MTNYDFDLFTIGAGSGGVACSRRAGSYGAKVAVAEMSRVGGTCVLRGCVPKKLLVYGASIGQELEDAPGYGWTIEGAHFDWSTLIANKNKELNRLNKIYVRMLKDSGCTLIDGQARIVDPHTVEVGGQRYRARYILVATGGWPVLPRVPGIEHVITSNEALELQTLPKRVVIVGGGYIAVEFAGIFNALGAQVTILIRGDMILRGFDEDIRFGLSQEMTKKGIRISCETQVKSIEKDGDVYTLLTTGEDLIEADCVLYATGRAPKTQGLGLTEVGVKLTKHAAVQVDAFSRTNVPSIYAVGDVTDRLNLTPVAIAEGRAVAETLFNNNPQKIDHSNVPTAIFSMPPAASVGLTEDEARCAYPKIDIYASNFRPMKHTLGGRDERSHMKVVVDGRSQRVLGCHMVGIDAPEIIQGLAIAMKCGATKRDFDATIGIHPSSAEEFVTMRDKKLDR